VTGVLPTLATALVFALVLRGWPSPGAGDDSPWPVSTPEEQGVDSVLLAEMLEEIDEAGHDINSVTVIRHGSIVLDASVVPYRLEIRHVVHSCTKSVVSTLIGIAIEEGAIAGVDVPFLDLFGDVAPDNVDAAKETMTLEHVLTMATGMDSHDSYLYRWRGIDEMARTDDWTLNALSFPMIAEPGTRFDYSNTASYLLSSALQRATGMTAEEYATEHLFGPLGITDYTWPQSPEDVSIGWGEMSLLPHDMAKLGSLYLHGGVWDGEQIVPAEWVATATREHIPAETLMDGYGYQWWVEDDGYFMALGYAGQYIVVLPEQDAVVVFTSELAEEQFFVPYELLQRSILPAMESADPLPENPDGVARLDAAIGKLAAEE